MSKKSFSAAAEAATQALLNAQRVDASVITDECGNVAIRKAPWNDTETIAEEANAATSSTSSLMPSRARRDIPKSSIPRMAP